MPVLYAGPQRIPLTTITVLHTTIGPMLTQQQMLYYSAQST